jgi:hypothetical protein
VFLVSETEADRRLTRGEVRALEVAVSTVPEVAPAHLNRMLSMNVGRREFTGYGAYTHPDVHAAVPTPPFPALRGLA